MLVPRDSLTTATLFPQKRRLGNKHVRRTLFHLPHEVLGIPLFGFGWVLFAWCVGYGIFLLLLSRREGWGAEVRSHLPFVAIVAVVISLVLPRIEVMAGAQFGLPIRGYGVMLLIAVASGLFLAVHRARQHDLDSEIILSLAIWMFVFGIIGARLFYVIQKWKEFQTGSMWEVVVGILNVTQGGLVVYGSLIGALLGAFIFVKRNRLSPLPIADIITPSLPLGLAIGRIGCLLNGCCYGGECHQPWAISFPPDSVPYVEQQRDGLLHGIELTQNESGGVAVKRVLASSAAEAAGLHVNDLLVALNDRKLTSSEGYPAIEMAHDILLTSGPEIIARRGDGSLVRWSINSLPARSVPIHPTQLYSSINALLLCFFLLAYSPFQRRNGELFAIVMTIYPVTRFLLEIIRTDEGSLFSTGMTISQNVSIAILLAITALWIVVLRQPKNSPGAAGDHSAAV